MWRIVSRGSVYRLGERGTRRKKRKPLTGKQLEELIQRNRDQEQSVSVIIDIKENIINPPGRSKSLLEKGARPQPQHSYLTVKNQGGTHDHI